MSDPAYTVDFTEMKYGTREEYLKLREIEIEYMAETPARLIQALEQQDKESLAGYKITRAAHGLQSASRAWDEGADIDWIVGALLHDSGDGLAPHNHGEMAAAVLKPFVREEVTWCVDKHGAFQMVYYAHHYGWNREERAKFKDHPHYQACVDFCEFWDQASFDPDYNTRPLSFFTPLVEEVFARTPYDPDVIQPGVHMPLRDEAVAAARV